MRWQRIQVMAFVLECLRGNQSRLGNRTMLHPHRGPLECLPVQILQALKAATRQEAGLHAPETPFVSGLSIAMSNFMADEFKAVLLGERDHLGHDDGVLARASQAGQVRVVDNAFAGRMTPVHQRLVQKALHREAVKHAIELEVLSLRVTQVEQTGNHFGLPPRQLHPIHGRIVLHLHARLIRHAITTDLRWLANPQLGQQASQRRIADLDVLLLEKLLVDALDPVLTVPIKTLQKLSVDVDFVFPW